MSIQSMLPLFKAILLESADHPGEFLEVEPQRDKKDYVYWLVPPGRWIFKGYRPTPPAPCQAGEPGSVHRTPRPTQ